MFGSIKKILAVLAIGLLAAGGWGADEEYPTEKDGVRFVWKLAPPIHYEAEHVWPLVINCCAPNEGGAEQDSWPLFAEGGFFMLIVKAAPANNSAENVHDSVLSAIAKVKEKYKIDDERVFTLGYSATGRLAMYEAFTFRKLFAGAICVCHCYAAKTIYKAKPDEQPLRTLLITGPQDMNYRAIKGGLDAYHLMGHDEVELKEVEGLGHKYRKSEVPMQIDWLNRTGPVKSYTELLSQAQAFEEKKNSKAALEIYNKLAKSKRAYPAVYTAEKRLAELEQAATAVVAKAKAEREQKAEAALAEAHKLIAEKKDFGAALARLRKVAADFPGTPAAQAAASEAATADKDPAVRAALDTEAAGREYRAQLALARNFAANGMKDRAIATLDSIMQKQPGSKWAQEAARIKSEMQ